jgi:hypothetical protein
MDSLGFTVTELSRGYRVALRGAGPDVDIECEDISTTTLNVKDVAALSPTWFEPGRPLARAGIGELAAKLQGRRRSGHTEEE